MRFLLLLMVLITGCYEPKLAPCAVRCASGVGCPDDTVCGPDANCHDPGDTMFCPPSMLTVTVRMGGSGTGSIAGGPINCGATCVASLLEGTVISLVATPAAESRFDTWAGPCMPDGDRCELVVLDDVEIEAQFIALATLEAVFDPEGTGAGRVTSDPAGIDCAASCSASFDSGSTVKLFAMPDDGSQLTMWSGACAGSDNCTVTLNGSQTVSVRFDAL